MKTLSNPLLSAIWPLVLFMLISGCSTSRKTTSLIDQSNAAYEAGNYTEALNGYEKLIAHWDENNQSA